MTELARPFGMALSSFSQHLDVLEDSGLVSSRKEGRVRMFELVPLPLFRAGSWLTECLDAWESRLSALDTYLLTLQEKLMARNLPFPIDPRLDLVLERVIDVPRELVWAAWTTPELIKRWFTPAPWQTVDCEMDLRPGGIFRTVMRSPEGEEFPNVGCYLEVVEHEKLVWTDVLGPGYRPKAPSPGCGSLSFTAVLLLEPHGSGTKYTAIAIHRDEEDTQKHREMGFHEGWGAALDQLVSLAKSM